MEKLRKNAKKRTHSSHPPTPTLPNYNDKTLTKEQLLAILQELILNLRNNSMDSKKRSRSTPDVLLRAVNIYWTLKFNDEIKNDEEEDVDRGMRLVTPDKEQWKKTIKDLHAENMAQTTSSDKHKS